MKEQAPNCRKYLKIESEFGDMITDGRYKYMRFFQGARKEQLYDLEEDPGEMQNFLHTPSYDAILRDFKNKLGMH